MLHAFLHGKIDESLPELDRREDALTSTAFGALVWTGSWNLLARPVFTRQSRRAGDDQEPPRGDVLEARPRHRPGGPRPPT